MQSGRQGNYISVNVRSLDLMWAAIIVLAVGCIILAFQRDAQNQDRNTYYSRYQSYEAAFKDYTACKAQAPKGFDCIMQPVLVSEQFIKEQYK